MTIKGSVAKWMVVAFGALASVTAMAAHPQISGPDMALLPPYCKPKLGALIGGGGFNKAEFDTWAETLGPEFSGIHHYCWALHYTNLYHRRVSDPKRASYLSNALSDIDYVLKGARPEFKLLAEIETKKATIFKLMGRESEAVQLLTRVTQTSPTYVGAYQQLSDFYADRKQKSKALEVVEAGLAQVPESKLLRRRYKELGGTKPLPELPAAPVESAPESQSGPQPEAAEAARQPAEVSANQADIRTPTAQTNQPSAQGTPSNPYCRFCPDQ